MADQAHEWTDGEIERLERRFRRQYNQASREMRKRLDDMMESYDKANAEWKQRVKSGDATQEDYDGWLKGQATDRAFVQSMAQTLAQDANRTNQLAMDTVNDAIPSVFAENANYAAFEVEHGIGYETHAFDLYDQSTVRRLIRDEPDLLPPLPKPRMDNGRDLRWNRQKFASVITQSVLQGESIPMAADRIGRVMRMNEAAATRAARTALTGAENAGRVDSYKRAQNIGIELEQEWLATHDERTRITHRLLDGEHVPVGKRFVPDGYGDKYSISFPGDPTALGEMVYNCRCTLVAWLPSIAEEDNRSWAKLPDGMTYNEWKRGKEAEQRQADEVPDIDSWGTVSHFDAVNNSYMNQLKDDLAELSALPHSDFVKTNETIAFANTSTPLRFMLRDYWGSMKYEAVNGQMRGHVSDEIRQWIDRLQKRLKEDAGYTLDEGIALGKAAISKTNLDSPIVVHRYIREDNDAIAEALSGIGTEFIDDAFVSTTTVDHGDGVDFIGSAPAYITHIYVPAGKGRGLPAQAIIDKVTDCSNYADRFAAREDEFTLAPSTKFRVVERKGNEVWLTVID